MTEREYRQELEKAKRRNEQKEKEREIRKEKLKYNTLLNACKKLHRIETSKLFAGYLFVLMNVIVLYAMVAMWHFSDLSYLGVLITDIAAQILVYAIYCLKAYKGKNAEEEMKFRRETAMLESDETGTDGSVG